VGNTKRQLQPEDEFAKDTIKVRTLNGKGSNSGYTRHHAQIDYKPDYKPPLPAKLVIESDSRSMWERASWLRFSI